MAKPATIQVDPEFYRAHQRGGYQGNFLHFFDRCLRWAQKLNNIAGGNVSVNLFRHDYDNAPFASFRWKGQDVGQLALDVDTGRIWTREGRDLIGVVTDENIWPSVFLPGLSLQIRVGMKNLDEQKKRLMSTDWHSV